DRRVVTGTFTADSCVEPDGIDGYHAASAGGVSRSDVPAQAEKRAGQKRDARISVVGGTGSRCGWFAGACEIAGDKTGGGEAPRLRAAAGGRGDDKCRGDQRAPV